MKEFKFFIAGVQHHRYKEIIKNMEEGKELQLNPELTNKYDPNAVRIVWYEPEADLETMIGYVPAKKSAEVSAFISIAEDPVCIITAFDPTAKPWEMFEVTIKEREVEDE